MPADDPYRTLGLERSATLDEVKRAYRRLVKVNHPDAAGEAALPRFLAIQDAYDRIVGPDPGDRRGATPTRPRSAWEADPFATAAPGGESGGDVAARAFPVLEPVEEWLAASHARAAVVVAHNHVLRLRLAALTGVLPADYRRRFVLEPGSYSIVTLGAGRRSIRRIGVLPASA